MNLGIFLEASNQKGMGHLFRMINFVNYLSYKKINYYFFINDDKNSLAWLNKQNLNFDIVNYNDTNADWESEIIKKYKIDCWINDRLDTKRKHSENVKKNNIKLVTFDDAGSGAELADINICALPCRYNINKGIKVLKGIEYLILNPDIKKYKRIRTDFKKLLVTLGGSDTYGVTLKVAEILKRQKQKATIITGPGFLHSEELEKFSNGFFEIKSNVKNLIKEFYDYDLAITGGGVTPFEANATGLPCMIIANEIHEIENAKFLNAVKTSLFLGYQTSINDIITFVEIKKIMEYSEKGINEFIIEASQKIIGEIREL